MVKVAMFYTDRKDNLLKHAEFDVTNISELIEKHMELANTKDRNLSQYELNIAAYWATPEVDELLITERPYRIIRLHPSEFSSGSDVFNKIPKELKELLPK